MIEIAQMVIVVADHSKFDRTALTVIAPVEHSTTSSPMSRHVVPWPPFRKKLKKKFVFA